MLTEERYSSILDILARERFCSAKKLAEQLFVSLPTIRRDLAELERRGLILRTHGGAGILPEGHFQLPLSLRTPIKTREKKALCWEAAKLVKDGDILFIDASSTVRPLADALRNLRRVTVITNSIPLAALLCDRGIRTYCTGGEVAEVSHGLVGYFAERFLDNFNIDLFFFSSFGVSRDGMIVDTSEGETSLRRTLMQKAAKRVFLCDGEKFDRSAPYNLCPIREADLVITNTPPPDSYGILREHLITVGK